MDYFLAHVPALAANIVPLFLVAETKAKADATAGGTPFHLPRYTARLTRHKEDLLSSVRAGTLKVCDGLGKMCDADAFLESCRAAGTLTEVLRPTRSEKSGFEVDADETRLSNLLVSLHLLNLWAGPRGDHFAIAAGINEWIDERGIVAGKQEAVNIRTPLQTLKRPKKATLQQDAILKALMGLGLDPKNLPPYTRGQTNPHKRAVERELVGPHGMTTPAFNKAWQALRNTGALVSPTLHPKR